jgi:oligoendopeptidase F
MADAAMLAARFDIDVRSRAFWDTSLDTLRRHIDEYVTLTGTVPRAGQP